MAERETVAERDMWFREQLDALTAALAIRREPWGWRDLVARFFRGKRPE